MTSPPTDPRRAAIEAVAGASGIAQAELIDHVRAASGASASAALAAIRALEREGTLASTRVERRKAYVLGAGPMQGGDEAGIAIAAPPPQPAGSVLLFRLAVAGLMLLAVNVAVVWLLANV